MRWALPASLLAVEYAALSLLVDFPSTGPAMPLVSVARMLVPAVMGGGAAGWLIARRVAAPGQEVAAVAPGAWRPWPALALHLAAFSATAALAVRLFGSGAPVGMTPFLLWLGCALATALLALATAAPAASLLRAASRHLGVPVLAVAAGLLSWRAVVAAEGLWGILQTGTLHAVAAVLRLVTSDVVAVPAERLVGVNGFEVIVAPICSGVDGLGLVVVFEAVWLSFARSRVHVGRAVLLLAPLGAAAALGANVLRIAGLVLLGASGREELALGAFHSKLGWILFVLVALASAAAVEHVPWVRRPCAREPARDGIPPAAAAYVAPLVAALAVALITSLWATGGVDRAYALRALAAAAVVAGLRRALPTPSLSPSLAPVLLGAAIAAIWIAAAGAGSAPPAALLASGERAAWVAARLLGSCLVLPVVEELAFRGFLLPWLVDADFEAVSPRAWTWPAVLLSSAAFGALHDRWILGTLAGAVFAAARARRGRLSDAIVAHAVANAGIAAAVLLGGRWQLWS